MFIFRGPPDADTPWEDTIRFMKVCLPCKNIVIAVTVCLGTAEGVSPPSQIINWATTGYRIHVLRWKFNSSSTAHIRYSRTFLALLQMTAWQILT